MRGGGERQRGWQSMLKRMLWGEVDEMETYWEDVFII
jgi:hypothetical protein